MSTEEEQKKKVEEAKEVIARALSWIKGRKYTDLSMFTLESAVEERIREIEGGDGDPGELGDLDAMINSIDSAVGVLKSNG